LRLHKKIITGPVYTCKHQLSVSLSSVRPSVSSSAVMRIDYFCFVVD